MARLGTGVCPWFAGQPACSCQPLLPVLAISVSEALYLSILIYLYIFVCLCAMFRSSPCDVAEHGSNQPRIAILQSRVKVGNCICWCLQMLDGIPAAERKLVHGDRA